jgi:YVTN family beta-propeller protein
MKTCKARPQNSNASGHLLPLMVSVIIALTTASRADNLVSGTAAATLPKNTVIATIAVGGAGGSKPVVAPLNNFIYVAGANTVSVIDASTNSVTKTFSESNPYGLAISPNGKTLYVADPVDGEVFVVQSTSGALIKTLAVPGAHSFTLSPSGKELYVVCSDSVSIIDIANNTVLSKSIQLAGYPDMLAFTPNSAYAYVTNGSGLGYLDRITLSSGKSAIIGGGELDFPVGICISPDGKTLYTNDASNYVAVFDAVSGKLTKTVLIGAQTESKEPYDIALTPSGKFLYTPISQRNGSVGTSVLMVDTAEDRVAGAPITVGNAPTYIGISPDGTRAYVTNFNDGTVSVIDISLN